MYRLKTPQFIANLALLAFTAMLLVCSSCGSTKPVITQKDSTIVRSQVIPRDTTIKTPAAKVALQIPFNVLLAKAKQNYDSQNSPGTGSPSGTAGKEAADQAKPGKHILGTGQNKQASVSASIQDGNLNIECACDSMEIAATLLDRYLQTDRTRTITLPPVEVKYIPWYIKALAWAGGLYLVATVIMAYIGVKRKLSK